MVNLFSVAPGYNYNGRATRIKSGIAARPETFRLPKSGGDPFFGLSRSFYYAGEQRGYWRLIRIRDRGKLRGVTLVPFDAVAQFVRQHMKSDNETS